MQRSPVSAPALGAGGRGFESLLIPTKKKALIISGLMLFSKPFYYKIFILLIKKKGIFAHQWTQKPYPKLILNFNQYGNSQTNNFQSKKF